MNIKDIRRENFRALLAQVGYDREVMASMLNFKTVSMIAQILNPPKAPGARVKNIGDKLARKCEVAFNKAEGWMDSINMTAEEMAVGKRYGMLPPDKRATVQGVLDMAAPPAEPTPLEGRAPDMQTKRRKQRG